MTIAFKLNRTKKKVNYKFEIAINFKIEIPLKINRIIKKVHQKIEIAFIL